MKLQIFEKRVAYVYSCVSGGTQDKAIEYRDVPTGRSDVHPDNSPFYTYFNVVFLDYTMPYAQNGDTRIYYEVTGDGFPLMLQHGLLGTHEIWERLKYVDTLRRKYRLILIDARGRGKSSKPHDPKQYSMKHMTGDVVSILDDLGIGKTVFWGYSLGGRVGLALGKYAPDRLYSLIIGGNGLSEKDSKEEVEGLQEEVRFYRRGMDAIVSSIGDEWGDNRDFMRSILLDSDLEALIAYCSFYENIGMADYLPKLNIPCLLYAGEEDTYPHSIARACAEIMRNAEFLSLPGLNHMGAMVKSSVVIPHVMRFLEKVTRV
jgi:pimeloyl-ACP methyl ester carboxylesterase